MKFLSIFQKKKNLGQYLVLVFRRHYLGFQCSWQNKRLDRVFKREISNKREFFYKILLPEKVNLGIFFISKEIDLNLLLL